MLLLHGSVVDNRFLLWGERPPLEAIRKGRRRAKLEQPSFSPFDPGTPLLAEALVQAAPAADADDFGGREWIAWLPSGADRPLPSSPLLTESPETPADVTVRPWQVSALTLRPAQVAALLGACVGRDVLAPGLVVGRTLAFWATAFRLAGALVARQQFLPGVRQSDREWRASWQPILAGTDTGKAVQLSRAMPQACRALGERPDTPPTTAAAVVLDSFLETMVDHLVRSAPEDDGGPLPARRRGKRPSFDSIHDAWLHALRSPDATLTAKPADLDGLVRQVQDWRRPIALTSAAPFRLGFRLEEPPEDAATAGDGWYLRFLLQAVDDPSLLVPVADAWNPRGKTTAVLSRGGFQPRAYLLTTLGQAAGLYPAIEPSLKSAAPAGVALDTTAAHQFLTEKAWLLEQAGFGVFLPAWWTRKGTKQRLTVRAHVKSPPMSGSGLTLEELVKFDWQVAIGDALVSLKELEALAKLKAPLVRLRGQWVQLNADEIQAAIDFWKKADGQGTVREVLRLAVGASRPAGPLDFAGVQAEGAVADLLSQLEGGQPFTEEPIPPAFRGTLRPYQVRGYSWLAFLRRLGLGACLADDMGLGKTVQTLALLQREWPVHKRPTLLVCPMSVVGNWQKEAERCIIKRPFV